MRWTYSFGLNAVIVGIEVHKRVIGVHLGPLTLWLPRTLDKREPKS